MGISNPGATNSWYLNRSVNAFTSLPTPYSGFGTPWDQFFAYGQLANEMILCTDSTNAIVIGPTTVSDPFSFFEGYTGQARYYIGKQNVNLFMEDLNGHIYHKLYDFANMSSPIITETIALPFNNLGTDVYWNVAVGKRNYFQLVDNNGNDTVVYFCGTNFKNVGKEYQHRFTNTYGDFYRSLIPNDRIFWNRFLNFLYC